jgi:hypothetical protein
MNLLKTILSLSPTLAKTPRDMWPFGLLNSNGHLTPGVHKFLSNFEEENYRVDYPEFHYVINDLGFRDPYPATGNENVMGFFGCSLTFGEGLDSSTNFPHKISKHYGHECLNLGIGGSSARRTALIFNAAIRVWKMRLAVVTLPGWNRTLYVDELGKLRNLHMNFLTQDDILENYIRFANDTYCMFETREAIESIQANAKLCNVPVIMTSWETFTWELATAITGEQTPLYEMWSPDAVYDPEEYARDDSHPGVRLVDRFTRRMIDYIDKNNLLAKN